MILSVKVQECLNRVFCDYPIKVEEPKEWWAEYKEIGPQHEGYDVMVTYKYSGRQKRSFIIDNGHLFLITPEMALKRAWKFYNRMTNKIKKHNDNSK